MEIEHSPMTFIFSTFRKRNVDRRMKEERLVKRRQQSHRIISGHCRDKNFKII